MELSEIKKNEESESKPHKNLQTLDSADIVQKKRSILRRLFDDIKPENDESIIGYVVTKVIVPSVLNTIHDALVSSIDIFFTGSPRRDVGSRKRIWNPDGEFDYTSRAGRTYDGSNSQLASQSTSLRHRREDYRDYLTFRSHLTATQLKDILQSYIDEEGKVTVEDLYHTLDLDEKSDWYDASIGWLTLNGTRIRQVGRDKWELVLPRLEKL